MPSIKKQPKQKIVDVCYNEEALSAVNSVIDNPLSVEIILCAMQHIRQNPTATVVEAIEIGKDEWDV